MKNLKIQLYSLFALLLITAGAMAQEDNKTNQPYSKKKTVSETYDLDKSGKVDLDNSFGDVKINIWNGSQVKINISVEASADNEADAQKLVDKTILTYGKKGKDVFMKNSFKNNEGWSKRDKPRSFQVRINCDIYVPAWATLDIENQFGHTVLPDYSGELSLKQQFGDIKAGNLSNAKKINLDFGGADIRSLNNCKLDIGFANKPVMLQNLSGTNEVKLRFCNNGVYVFSNSGNTNIKAEHSKLNVITGNSFNGDLDIKTSFGSFKNNSSVNLTEKGEKPEYGPQLDKHFVKDGSGSGSITVNADFTDLVLSNQKETFSAGKKGGKASKDDEDEDDKEEGE
jgi:hypothetical protein